MRIMFLIMSAATLGGCTFSTDYPVKPPPAPGSLESVSRSKNEDWTREQRHCEVGDRKDQRRCVMDRPDD